MDVDITFLLARGPESPHPHPSSMGCQNEQEAYDPPRVEGKGVLFWVGHQLSSTQAAQPAGLLSLVASFEHGQNKVLYNEIFPSAHHGGLSQRVSLWDLK